MELCTLQRQEKKFRFLLDGAHNEAGVATLHQNLCARVIPDNGSCLSGAIWPIKIWSALLELMAMADAIILTRAESQRSAVPAALYEQLPSLARTKSRCAETVEQALEMVDKSPNPMI